MTQVLWVTIDSISLITASVVLLIRPAHVTLAWIPYKQQGRGTRVGEHLEVQMFMLQAKFLNDLINYQSVSVTVCGLYWFMWSLNQWFYIYFLQNDKITLFLEWQPTFSSSINTMNKFSAHKSKMFRFAAFGCGFLGYFIISISEKTFNIYRVQYLQSR